VMMPRKNGMELAREFVGLRPAARVLYMTGYAEIPGVADALFVHKPFTVFVLMEAVRRALEGASRMEYASARS